MTVSAQKITVGGMRGDRSQRSRNLPLVSCTTIEGRVRRERNITHGSNTGVYRDRDSPEFETCANDSYN